MMEDRRPNVEGQPVEDRSSDTEAVDPEATRRSARLLADREGVDGHEEAPDPDRAE